MNIIDIKLTNGFDRSVVEDLVFFSLLPFKNYSQETLVSFFIECMSSMDLNIATLHVLQIENKPTAFAFILDAFEGQNDSAPHLHVLSVFPSKQKLNIGSEFLQCVIAKNNFTGLTLECDENTIPFFAKNNFTKRDVTLECGQYSMFYGDAEKKDRFKRPQVEGEALEKYLNDYYACSQRLEEKGHI
ncbi:GNAT family N-acetyltransferase [Shewanella woodyi]|uniref:N-acetyltransferase domain-containing protein n=1 Tax=Shewanella woodyi (strain ATCC 51908 / MS32) TaxID=392500 RepID=B1KGD8_SHEWM|nr:hypothetical protein [Shewanella woodyi]ACA88275.1 hypothetical protein Swoo_4019 [Shewanella woodyi ATCC 51908]